MTPTTGRGTLGVQNSRECTEIIKRFFECQKTFGMWQKIGGACLNSRDKMDKCLYNEYINRRTQNLNNSRERMERFSKLKKSESDV